MPGNGSRWRCWRCFCCRPSFFGHARSVSRLKVNRATLTRFTLAGAAAAVLALGIGCMKELPVGPSELTTGITIYEHANFEGKSAHVTADISDLSDYRDGCHKVESCTGTAYISCTTSYDWDDCISSVKLAPGWRATIYRDDDFHGESLDVTADVPNLQLVSGTCDHDGLNDCISSVRVRQQ